MRGSRKRALRCRTNSSFISITTSVQSLGMCLRIWLVKFPRPGPYSTITRARSHSIGDSKERTRNRELGTTEPTKRGCLKKFLAKSRVCVATELAFLSTKYDFSDAQILFLAALILPQ